MRRSVLLLAAALALVAGGTAQAKEDLGDLLNALNAERAAAARIELIERLGATRSERAAQALSGTARTDADAKVRIAAAKALVAFRNEAAFTSLKELLVAGGIRDVRRQAALGMSAMPDGLAWTVRRIASEQITDRERLLLVSSLGDFPSLDAAGALERLAASDDAAVRCTALRAMARHAAGRAELARVALDVLKRRTDVETALAVLDACDGVCDADLGPVLPDLLASRDRRVAAAASWLQRRIDAAEAAKLREQQIADNAKRAKDGYAPLDLPPVPETVAQFRPKVDTVLVYDATGSMAPGHGKSLPEETLDEAARDEARRETSFRHAWVAMQDTRREASDPWSQFFPPVFDASPLRTARWRQTSVGVDTEGIAVGAALREVLDRFEWRAGAARRIVVVSDNYVGDLDLARRTVSAHHDADGFELEIVLVTQMSDHRRDGWADLARTAGTTLPERKK